MSFDVSWLPSAKDELLRIVLSHPRRTEVVNALNYIANGLQAEGDRAGESRDEGHRVLFALPLGVRSERSMEYRLPI